MYLKNNFEIGLAFFRGLLAGNSNITSDSSITVAAPIVNVLYLFILGFTASWWPLVEAASVHPGNSVIW